MQLILEDAGKLMQHATIRRHGDFYTACFSLAAERQRLSALLTCFCSKATRFEDSAVCWSHVDLEMRMRLCF
jgi:hypothetical protein